MPLIKKWTDGTLIRERSIENDKLRDRRSIPPLFCFLALRTITVKLFLQDMTEFGKCINIL